MYFSVLGPPLKHWGLCLLGNMFKNRNCSYMKRILEGMVSLFVGNSNEYFDIFTHTLPAVGMSRVHRKWFMSQKYWYTRAWAQGSEKEKQEATKLHNRLVENVCQKRGKSIPERNPWGCLLGWYKLMFVLLQFSVVTLIYASSGSVPSPLGYVQ